MESHRLEHHERARTTHADLLLRRFSRDGFAFLVFVWLELRKPQPLGHLLTARFTHQREGQSQIQIHLNRWNAMDAIALRRTMGHPLVVRRDQPFILAARFLMKSHRLPLFFRRKSRHAKSRQSKAGKLIEQQRPCQARCGILRLAPFESIRELPQNLLAGPCCNVAAHDVVLGKIASLAPGIERRA